MDKVLFLKANPIDSKDLRLENEEKAINFVLMSSPNKENFEIESRGSVTMDDLTSYLHAEKPQYLHISGHANSEREFFLEDNEGYKNEIPIHKFIKLIENFDSIQCLFLNACHSLSDSQSLESTIPYIIGMKDKVKNSYALEFSRQFYKTLFSVNDVGKAFNLALDYMDTDKYPEEIVPQLIISENTLQKLNEGKELKYPLVTKEEIQTAKDFEIKLKKIYIRGLVILAIIILFFILYLILKVEIKESTRLIATIGPLLISGYPIFEIIKRIERHDQLVLFEMRVNRFKKAFNSLTIEDKKMLNKHFQKITKLKMT